MRDRDRETHKQEGEMRPKLRTAILSYPILSPSPVDDEHRVGDRGAKHRPLSAPRPHLLHVDAGHRPRQQRPQTRPQRGQTQIQGQAIRTSLQEIHARSISIESEVKFRFRAKLYQNISTRNIIIILVAGGLLAKIGLLFLCV